MNPNQIFGAGIGQYVLIALIVLAAIVILQSSLPKPLRVILVIALALRVLGSTVRIMVLYMFYHGVGDAQGYYGVGIRLAAFAQAFDWASFFDEQHWFGGRWWGTTPMHWISGFVLSIIGNTMLGEFIVFSLLAFLGLLGFVVAFKRSFPSVPLHRYARWVWLFPSLWFWPSSVGKEAIVMFGLGLSVMGFIGIRDRIRWLPLAAGMFMVFIIRPQLAALFLVVAITAYWLGRGARWSAQKTVEAIIIAAVSIGVVTMGLQLTGMESFDLEGMGEYIEGERGREVGGGSAIEAPEIGLLGVPMAIVNVLFRPFPWEAANVMMVASSLELMLLWVLILYKRRRLMQNLRGWRSSRMLRLAVAFVFVYTVSLGMMVANLGVLARQRIFLFPFLFIFLEAVAPVVRRVPWKGHPRTFGRVPAATGPGGPPWTMPVGPGRSSSR